MIWKRRRSVDEFYGILEFSVNLKGVIATLKNSNRIALTAFSINHFARMLASEQH